jgi:hypothetical protein
MGTRSVRDPGDGLAHSSELDVVVRDAPDVAGPLGPQLADAALCSGELRGGEHAAYRVIATGSWRP